MRTDRPLVEVTCPGCSATFQSHLKSVVFCSERCRLCSWALRPPRSCCFVCGAWLRWEDAISRGLTNEEFWQEQAAFPDQHRACVVEDLDRVLGRERLVCRCKSCRLERGEVVESKPKRPRRNRPASVNAYLRAKPRCGSGEGRVDVPDLWAAAGPRSLGNRRSLPAGGPHSVRGVGRG